MITPKTIMIKMADVTGSRIILFIPKSLPPNISVIPEAQDHVEYDGAEDNDLPIPSW